MVPTCWTHSNVTQVDATTQHVCSHLARHSLQQLLWQRHVQKVDTKTKDMGHEMEFEHLLVQTQKVDADD